MKVEFVKYQGTGNDFIMLNNMDGIYNSITISQIQFLCDRKIGIGADGLIKISKSTDYDFEVEYFNSDGSQSFCGNGARCSVLYANDEGIINENTRFLAIDGVHEASIVQGLVRVEMLPVANFAMQGTDYVLDTGSPHFVRFSDSSESIDIVELGKSIRYSERFKKDGINVNLVNVLGERSLEVQTYERGVEDETLSCGTGVTAAALVYMHMVNSFDTVEVKTKGGTLKVEAQPSEEKSGFVDIWLSGPATSVYRGIIEV